jgi:hypothetical protein
VLCMCSRDVHSVCRTFLVRLGARHLQRQRAARWHRAFVASVTALAGLGQPVSSVRTRGQTQVTLQPATSASGVHHHRTPAAPRRRARWTHANAIVTMLLTPAHAWMNSSTSCGRMLLCGLAQEGRRFRGGKGRRGASRHAKRARAATP